MIIILVLGIVIAAIVVAFMLLFASGFGGTYSVFDTNLFRLRWDSRYDGGRSKDRTRVESRV